MHFITVKSPTQIIQRDLYFHALLFFFTVQVQHHVEETRQKQSYRQTLRAALFLQFGITDDISSASYCSMKAATLKVPWSIKWQKRNLVGIFTPPLPAESSCSKIVSYSSQCLASYCNWWIIQSRVLFLDGGKHKWNTMWHSVFKLSAEIVT